MRKVIWEIESEQTNLSSKVEAHSYEDMIIELKKRGFKSILKNEEGYIIDFMIARKENGEEYTAMDVGEKSYADVRALPDSVERFPA